MPHRAFQAPNRSAGSSTGEITGTLPAGVSSQRRKPGTFSSMAPLTAGIFGPQQGSLPGPVPHPGDCAIGSNCSMTVVLPQPESRSYPRSPPRPARASTDTIMLRISKMSTVALIPSQAGGFI